MSRKWIGAIALTAVLFGVPLHAAQPNTYQVTGPVLALTNDTIVVQKGSERWEIARGAAKVTGDLKVGATVTVQYRMTATAIDVKPAKEAKPKKGKG
jgi:RNase P/RNase MRP subunit p29